MTGTIPYMALEQFIRYDGAGLENRASEFDQGDLYVLNIENNTGLISITCLFNSCFVPGYCFYCAA